MEKEVWRLINYSPMLRRKTGDSARITRAVFLLLPPSICHFVEEKRIFNFCSKESLKLTEDLFLKLRLCTDCIFISLRSRKLGRKVGFSKRSFGRATSGSNFRLNLPLSLSFQVILKQRRIGGSILAFPTFNRKTPLFDPRQSFEGTPLPFCLL